MDFCMDSLLLGINGGFDPETEEMGRDGRLYVVTFEICTRSASWSGRCGQDTTISTQMDVFV